jgi:hypothetical protein
MTLPGVGFINATALYASVGNASQFAKPRALSVWLGVTPKQYVSGEKSYNTGITKRGSSYLRKQLIHGARSLMYRAKKKHDKPSLWINQIVQCCAEERTKRLSPLLIASPDWPGYYCIEMKITERL